MALDSSKLGASQVLYIGNKNGCCNAWTEISEAAIGGMTVKEK